MNPLHDRIRMLSGDKRVLLEKAIQKKGLKVAISEALPPRGERSSAPLSFSQERLWILDQIDPGRFDYIRPLGLRFKGQLQEQVLARSLNEIISRHEVLRTGFGLESGIPAQFIHPPWHLDLPLTDLRSLTAGRRSEEERRITATLIRRSFNLAQGRLFRASLLRLTESEHLLLLSFHHIVFDWWSSRIFLRELLQFYEALRLGKPPFLPKLVVQYADFSLWQRNHFSGMIMEKGLDYWLNRLKDVPAVLEFPTDRPRPRVKTNRGARQSLSFAAPLTTGLKEISRQEGTSLFMTLLALLATFIYCYSRHLGRSDTQVKLRGQRVELGEIEHCLAAFPGVQQAVAIVDRLPNQTQRLKAFVLLDPQATAPTQAEWAAYLSVSLPSYMIPSVILRITSIPLTAAGKVDRQALLAALDTHAGSAPAALWETEGQTLRTPPQNAIERQIAEVWKEQLGLGFISREDHFFELGGNSLRAIAVISRLRRDFECAVNDLYEHPVLVDFAGLCHPRPDHWRAMVGAVRAAWREGSGVRAGSERERQETLRTQQTVYETRIRSFLDRDLQRRHPYRNALLSGATGYLGSYLLRELLTDSRIKVTAVVRGADDRSAHTRLGQVLIDYFGKEMGSALRDSQQLKVLAGDLRQAGLFLSSPVYGRLAETTDVIFHCAANVKHIGHYRDFYADNVSATRHLLTLAALPKPRPADFHFVSTLSVSGSTSPDQARLFTEYDPAPEEPDDNYYVRTKQEAEGLVIASRNELANACIHRIGNIALATDSACLQRNIAENAFFRQLAAFIRLGAVPVELKALISYVDVVARALMALAGTKTVTNETHHIETPRRDRLSDFIRSGDGMADQVRACDFGLFLERLQEAIDEPEMESAVAETLETLGLQSGRFLLTRLQRMSVVSDRTQRLLERLGITWPPIPPAGQKAMVQAALKAFRHEKDLL